MEAALKAFASPSWWVLSIVVGLLLNILAPFINKGIESLWASRSEKKKKELARAEASVQRRVKALASKSTGLLEAKLEVIYWAVLVVLVISVYLLIIQVVLSIPIYPISLFAIPIALVGFLNVTRYLKKWKKGREVHNLLLVEIARTERPSEV